MEPSRDQSGGSSQDMETLSQALERLRIKGYDHEFSWKDGHLNALGKNYEADQLTIIKTFRFEGESNPDDSSILYILKSSDGTIGYSIDSYGIYADHEDGGDYDNFMRRVRMDNREGQLLIQL